MLATIWTCLQHHLYHLTIHFSILILKSLTILMDCSKIKAGQVHLKNLAGKSLNAFDNWLQVELSSLFSYFIKDSIWFVKQSLLIWFSGKVENLHDNYSLTLSLWLSFVSHCWFKNQAGFLVGQSGEIPNLIGVIY